MSWEGFVASASGLLGIEQGTCFGTPALYVRKKFLARLREDGDSVVLKADFTERDMLLELDPSAFYLTDHYRPYPCVLMRLGRVRRALALDLFEKAWRRAAPKRLIAAHDARATRTTARA